MAPPPRMGHQRRTSPLACRRANPPRSLAGTRTMSSLWTLHRACTKYCLEIERILKRRRAPWSPGQIQATAGDARLRHRAYPEVVDRRGRWGRTAGIVLVALVLTTVLTACSGEGSAGAHVSNLHQPSSAYAPPPSSNWRSRLPAAGRSIPAATGWTRSSWSSARRWCSRSR